MIPLFSLEAQEPKYIVQVAQNPWGNVYWFARMLIASDKYGGVGGDRNTMERLASVIRTTYDSYKGEKSEVIVATLMEKVRDVLYKRWGGTKKKDAIEALCNDLSPKLSSPEDFLILAFTCERLLIPISKALENIPNNDRGFAESMVRTLLHTQGEEALPTVINLWDDLGAHGCMTAERAEIVRAFALFRDHISSLQLGQLEENLVLTAFCQEFERRIGQKRKGRAGRGVESVTSIILEYFGFARVSHGPGHFTTGLEVDRWVKCKDGWYIGISCKRTLRERWKQAYTTDLDLLNRHKIKALWHVLTFDRDLSDDKLTEMGSHRARFYLSDNSPRYLSASQHPGMRDYVRPISHFVSDLRAETS